MNIAAKYGAQRHYRGVRFDDNTVWVVRVTTQQGFTESVPLTPDYSLTLRNHSPTGFEWGYAGSGPAQLALALLLDALAFADPEGDQATRELIAKRNYQLVKAKFVQNWGPKWEISVDDIMTYLSETV
jgi:hypothetical protein